MQGMTQYDLEAGVQTKFWGKKMKAGAFNLDWVHMKESDSRAEM